MMIILCGMGGFCLGLMLVASWERYKINKAKRIKQLEILVCFYKD